MTFTCVVIITSNSFLESNAPVYLPKMWFKIIIGIFLMSLAVNAKDNIDWKIYRTAYAKCMAEYPLSEDVKLQLKDLELPNDKTLQQYMLCAVKEMGVYTKETGLNYERFATLYLSDVVDTESTDVASIARQCHEEHKGVDDEAIMIYNITKCGMKKAKKIDKKIVKNY